MDLKITGEVTSVLAEESGEGRNGPWRKRAFILRTPGEYPRDICIIQWGDNIDKFAIEPGETITAYIDIQSREFNGRWYTDVKAWRIDRQGDGGKGALDRDVPLPDEPGDLNTEEDALPF